MAEDTVISEPETGAAPRPQTIVIRKESGSGAGIVMALILLAAVVGAMYLLGMNSKSENAKDNAIAKAASDVGAAASKVGNAAENAAKNVKPD